MKLAALRSYLLSKPGSVETYPFDEETPVFKVGGKMFALVAPEARPLRVTLKLDPAHGQLLRGMWEAVLPGYHMNKEHWNTVVLDGSVPDEELRAWIDESYALVVAGLPRVARAKLPLH
jgi:predicted DNA-binding protein (MmcQ/YjbR family)